MQFHGDLRVNTVWKRNCFLCSNCQLPKTPWIVYWQYMAEISLVWGKSINLLKSHQKLQHTRGMREEVAEPQQHTSCQFCAACRRGWAQVCSSAYCSLAWVNKEKTGAIRQTCQAWNSLLMFTPFTLGLSQRCCLSPDFWQGPTAICFFSQSKQTIPVVCHTKHTWLAEENLPKDKCFKKLCMLKWHWGRVVPQQTRCRIKAKGWYFCDHTRLRHHPGWVWTSHKMPECIIQSLKTTFAWPAWSGYGIHSTAGEPDTAAF